MDIYTKIAEDLNGNGVVVETVEQLAKDDYFREYLRKHTIKDEGLARVFFYQNLSRETEFIMNVLFENIYDFFDEDNKMLREYLDFTQSNGENQLSKEFYEFCAERIIDNMEVA